MKAIHIITALALAVTCSCSNPQVNKTGGIDERVRLFISACERDIANASRVIAEQDLVKNLTHLNRMGSGGSHYYILEKEALTKMLNELCTYPYAECIVINSSNRIIYSMFDDTALGKSSLSFPGSPIQTLYAHSIKGEAFMTDVSSYPLSAGRHEFYFSAPIIKNGVIEGVIITSVDVKHLGSKIPEAQSIIDTNGVYRYHRQLEKIFTEDERYLSSEELTDENQVLSTADAYYEYQPFAYKELSWFIIIKHGKR